MEELQVINHNSVDVIDSREVAEMIGRIIGILSGTFEDTLKFSRIPLSPTLGWVISSSNPTTKIQQAERFHAIF